MAKQLNITVSAICKEEDARLELDFDEIYKHATLLQQYFLRKLALKLVALFDAMMTLHHQEKLGPSEKEKP